MIFSAQRKVQLRSATQKGMPAQCRHPALFHIRLIFAQLDRSYLIAALGQTIRHKCSLNRTGAWTNRTIVPGHPQNDKQIYRRVRGMDVAKSSGRLESKSADWYVKGCVMVVVARDGIEPPTPAFSGPTTNGPKCLKISGTD